MSPHKPCDLSKSCCTCVWKITPGTTQSGYEFSVRVSDVFLIYKPCDLSKACCTCLWKITPGTTQSGYEYSVWVSAVFLVYTFSLHRLSKLYVVLPVRLSSESSNVPPGTRYLIDSCRVIRPITLYIRVGLGVTTSVR